MKQETPANYIPPVIRCEEIGVERGIALSEVGWSMNNRFRYDGITTEDYWEM